MNSVEVEAAIIDFLRRGSIIEAISAQYFMFEQRHGRPPVLMQVNRLVQPAYWREMAQVTGDSIDEIATATGYGIEKARIQFTGLSVGVYIISLAPGKEPTIL